MRFISVLVCAAITLSGTGCIKHKWKGGVPPQPTPYPVLSLSTEKTLAVASMVRVMVNTLPDNTVTCLSIDIPKYGESFNYNPDSLLLKAMEGKVKVVSDKNCPPSYWNTHRTDKPFELVKPPPGYVEPFHVFITDLQFLGANHAKGTVIGTARSVRYSLPCNAFRTSRHNWRPSCLAGSYMIMAAALVGRPR